jgi:hypothetical protein
MAYTKRLDTDLLRAALVGYQHQHSLLGERIAEITRELGGKTAQTADTGTGRPKRVMSAATRRRMAASQQKRWAEKKGTAAGSPVKQAGTKKRKMSAEGRERIAEATRKRWEEYRAEKAAAQR